MLQVNQLIGFGAKQTGGYTANAVTFDGTNDYLTTGATLTGAADSKVGLISMWINTASDSASARFLLCSNSSLAGGISTLFFRTQISTSEEFIIVADNTGGSAILNIKSSAATVEAADGWVHCMATWDMADPGKRHLYINDTSDLNVTTYTNDTIDYTGADWSLGAITDGNNKVDADIADVYFTDEYLDLSTEANRRKFIDASGKPVDLGADASGVTGTQPLVYFSGDTSTWHTNLGSGGGFTENGALTDASTSPSD